MNPAETKGAGVSQTPVLAMLKGYGSSTMRMKRGRFNPPQSSLGIRVTGFVWGAP